MTLGAAVKADQEGRLVGAAALYEEALSEGDVPVDALMDMAILYWQATDYGYWTGKGLPVEFAKRAGGRFRQILDIARGSSPEASSRSSGTATLVGQTLGIPSQRRSASRCSTKIPIHSWRPCTSSR